MHRLVTLSCIVCLSIPALSEAETTTDSASEAITILKKADAATKAVAGVSYVAKVEPSGAATNFISGSQGKGVMFGWDGASRQPQKFYAHVKAQATGDAEPVEIEGGGNGDSYFLIDHVTKKAYEDMDPMVMGSGSGTLRTLAMTEFVHAEPFEDEINAEQVELLDAAKVGDEECYQIRVVYGGRRGESIWFFSKEDLLPRQRIQKRSMRGEPGSVTLTITELEVDPEVKADRYKLQLPKGYEQIDDFAP